LTQPPPPSGPKSGQSWGGANPAQNYPMNRGAGQPGIYFMKLHFGRKRFGQRLSSNFGQNSIKKQKYW
jgi:hypothetical protein